MTQGTKDDLWIYRMIAQGKGNRLPATEVIKTKYVSSIYHTLNRLCGIGIDTGGRLFCFQDITDIAKDFASESEKLKERIKRFYGSFFPHWNWRKVKVCSDKDRCANKIILIVAEDTDKNNKIRIRLYKDKKDDREKVKMTFRIKPVYDYSRKYPNEIRSLVRIKSALVGGSFFRKWIKHNYISIPVPLMPERRGQKLYLRTLLRKSHLRGGWKGVYLHSELNEKGQRRIQSYNKKIDNSTSGFRYQYQNFSMNVRGLLDYALIEHDPQEFMKTLRNLAESDEYHEMRAPFYQYDDDICEIPELQILRAASHSSYKLKNDFPFLSHYDILVRSLPENFVIKLLTQVAKKLQKLDDLGFIKLEGLKFMITDYFYSKIREIVNKRRDDSDNSNSIEGNKSLLSYLSEIGRYVQLIKREKEVQRKNLQRNALLRKRYIKICREIFSVIESNKDQDIIPIFKQVKEARIPWFNIRDLFNPIKNKYGKKFLITDLCLITKSKARELGALLDGNPSLSNARRLFSKHGVRKHWISHNLLANLGYWCWYENSDTEFKTLRVLKLEKKK